MRFFVLLLTVMSFWAPHYLYCQSAAFKYVKNYSRKDYHNQHQNWSVIQDRRGIIYVGNQGALLEFDGSSWRGIYVKNRNTRSLAVDGNGTIFIGGRDEFGFMEPDSKGNLQYVSLVEHLDDKKKSFGIVWRTFTTNRGVYFRTSKFLFRWYDGKLKVWESKTSFKAAFFWKNKFFVQEKSRGLMQMVNDSLQPISGGEHFALNKIYMFVPYGGHQILMGERTRGFLIYDAANGTVAPFPTEVDDYIKEKRLSHGIRLSSGEFALATLEGGLVIIDDRGNLKQIYNKATLLQDENVKYVFEDSQGNLWLALNKGISKIEYASPFSIYDDRSGLPGLVLSVAWQSSHNRLYTGTTAGLYSLAPGGHGKFVYVTRLPASCWFMKSIGDSLLAATDTGTFQVETNNIVRKVDPEHSYILSQSKLAAERIWVGTNEGLISLYREKDAWKVEQRFKVLPHSIRTIVEDENGNLWLGTLTQGVVKVDFPVTGSIHNPVVSRYDTSHGLPEGEIHVFKAAGQIMFASPERGLFRFDENKKVFVPDAILGTEFSDGSRGVFQVVEDKYKTIWFHSQSRSYQAVSQQAGTPVQYSIRMLRIPEVQVNMIYPEPMTDTVWFASHDGLIRYDNRGRKIDPPGVATVIRRVFINGRLVYDGYGDPFGNLFPVIDYKDRNLRFEFAAPYFEDESGTEYKYFLEGYDDRWSDWSLDANQDYTNLDSGTYRFRVKARNIYNDLSREAVFQFKVLPPWYKTWWAFFIYAVVVFLFIFFIVKWRSLKHELEKKKLEHIIGERTKEIIDKNEQLREQSEKLKEVDKVKSRFFANISHEFRTPLTLIMGPLEQMLGDSTEKRQRKKLDLMLRNSQRLLALINQLLELSKFESGKVKLNASQRDIISFLKGTVASFELLCTQRQLDISFHTQTKKIPLFFDVGKMEEVMCNILINAIKFTPPGGKITVRAKEKPGGFVEINISDTGPGIPVEQLTHVFDRFYQSETTHEYNRKGTGIGLAIAKELVELHHGEIQLQSEEGKGTEFTIRLPLGETHLEPGEMDNGAETRTDKKEPGEIPARYKNMIEPAAEVDNDGEKEETKNTGHAQKKDIILVVEDSTDVRDYIRSSIEPLYTVSEAIDGAEGMAKARRIIPDLIISDIMMPGADGYQLCRELKNDIKTSHIPIILLTAKASEENILEGIEVGADDYITKPFNTKILLARIKNLIDLRRQLQLNLHREMTFQPVKTAVSRIDREFLRDLKSILNKNISDPEFNVDQLSKKLYMSHTTLYRKIHAMSGETPSEFIRTFRLKRGAELLKRNFGTVLEVSFEVGFSSSSYFTKCFKEKFHQLPSTFQASEAQH
jgi:signal transduction histidine kinase/DNA-binding response OmpR family regulator